MQVVTVKFKPEVLKRIDNSITTNNFNSRTEFIREAVRDKLESLNKDKLINEFMKLQGKFKPKNNKNDKEIREEASKELMQELDKRFQRK